MCGSAFSKRFFLSQDNPDIRQQVEANRGPQKKLELLIPGLRGYRKLEDLRVSDELLRNQMADRLDHAKANLEALRKRMVDNNDLTNLGPAASLIFQIQQLSGEVRHAQQGYSGWVATISINDDKLNKLYEYDYAFVTSVMGLETATASASYDSTAPNSVQTALSQISSGLNDIKQKWAVRMEAIQGVQVK
jgi:hypothetical protein